MLVPFVRASYVIYSATMMAILQNKIVKQVIACPRKILATLKTVNQRGFLPLLKPRNSKPKTTTEPAKVALNKKRRYIILSFLIHFLPITATVALVCLNIRSVYWTDIQAEETRLSNILSALQFAAKLHELWITFSIASMVSQILVMLLTRSKGLPFGLIGAGVQAGSFALFVQRSFWSSLSRNLNGRKLQVRAFGLFLAISTIVMVLSGPSSAISIRPSLDWWPAPNCTIYLAFSTDYEIWPTTVSDSECNTCFECLNYTYVHSRNNCPGSGVNDINEWLGGIDGRSVQPGRTANFTFYAPTSNTHRLLTSSAQVTPGRSYTSSISVISHLVIGAVWEAMRNSKAGEWEPPISQPKLISTSTTPLQQPMVQVNCNLYSYVDSTDTSTGPDTQLFFPQITSLTAKPTFMNITSMGTPVPEDLWIRTPRDGNIHMNWVNLRDYNGSASIGGILMLPTAKSVYNGLNYDYIQDSMILPCTFDARWMRSQVSFDPTFSSIVNGEFSDTSTVAKLGALIKEADANGGSESTGDFVFSEILDIDLRWTEYIDGPTPFVLGSMGDTEASADAAPNTRSTAVELLLESNLVSTPNNTMDFVYQQDNATGWTQAEVTQTFISSFLGVIMTNGLARYAAKSATESYYLFSPDIMMGSPHDLPAMSVEKAVSGTGPGWHLWSFDIYRRGYSYGIRSSTKKLALGVLLSHVLLALGFMIYLCFVGWTTSAWSTVGELVALALKSRGTEQFLSTDAGIAKSETWAQNVRIREIGSEGLEMRFGDDGCREEKGEVVSRVRIGRKYGRGEGAQNPYEGC